MATLWAISRPLGQSCGQNEDKTNGLGVIGGILTRRCVINAHIKYAQPGFFLLGLREYYKLLILFIYLSRILIHMDAAGFFLIGA